MVFAQLTPWNPDLKVGENKKLSYTISIYRLSFQSSDTN